MSIIQRRIKGEGYSSIPLSLWDKIYKLNKDNEENEKFWKGITADHRSEECDNHGMLDWCKLCTTYPEYESIIRGEKIEIKINNFIEKSKAFSKDVNGKFIRLKYYKSDPSLNIDRYKIIRNTTTKYRAEINAIMDEMKLWGVKVSLQYDKQLLSVFHEKYEEVFFETLIDKEDEKTADIVLGLDVNGKVFKTKFNNGAHSLLIAASGAGKSTFMNTLIKQLKVKPGYEVEIWDIKKGKDFSHLKVRKVNETLDLIQRIKEVSEYVDNVNKGKIKKKHKELILMWDEFISGMGELDTFCNSIEKGGKELKAATINRINNIGQTGRSANVRLFLSTQRINESTNGMKGLNVLSNITNIYALNCKANTQNYIQQNMQVFEDVDLTALQKGVLWYNDGTNEDEINWFRLEETYKLSLEDEEEEFNYIEEEKEEKDIKEKKPVKKNNKSKKNKWKQKKTNNRRKGVNRKINKKTRNKGR